jgi:hypothetical protein
MWKGSFDPVPGSPGQRDARVVIDVSRGGEASPIPVVAYELTVGEGDEWHPSQWTLEGRVDKGSPWVRLDSRSKQLFPGNWSTRVFHVSVLRALFPPPVCWG